MENSIFDEADLQARKLLDLLEEGNNLFPKQLVPKKLLTEGMTYYKGIITPLGNVSYKYLYDDFEQPFLIAYIDLFGKILEEKLSVSNEFAFRTLAEMGSEDSFVLFDPRVDEEDKRLFKLLSLLADYSSIETSMRSIFNEWLNKLFEEHKAFLESKLSKGDFATLEELRIVIGEANVDVNKYTVLIKRVRQLFSRVKSDILNKYARKKIMQLSDGYKRMKSGESHMLHGNAFLIINRMRQQTKENHLFRVFAYLAISGNDMIVRLASFLKDDKFSEKVDVFLREHESFKKKFSYAWGESK